MSSSAVLRNEGAEVAAHEMIRREQHEAQGMERLSAEYLTWPPRHKPNAGMPSWRARDSPTTTSPAVAASAARGPLFAGLREAEARGLDVDDALPRLVAGRSLADAADVASVLHGRVDRWSQAAGGRRRQTGHLIAGLIPRVQGVSDPDMARALAERDDAMEQRARSLAQEAIAAGQTPGCGPWGSPPSAPAQRERWLREVSTVAAYRDRWHIEGQGPLGPAPDRENHEQNRPARQGALGREVGEGDQHTRSGPAEQSSLGATGRDLAGDRFVKEIESSLPAAEKAKLATTLPRLRRRRTTGSSSARNSVRNGQYRWPSAHRTLA
jgi:hypothetical protein